MSERRLALVHGENRDGLCPRCGDQPLPDGYAICQQCADRLGPYTTTSPS